MTNNFSKDRKLKSISVSFSLDITFVTESWLTEGTPNSVIPLAGWQSFRGTRYDRREGGCPVYVRQGISVSIPTHHTVKLIHESVRFTIKFSSQVIRNAHIYRPPFHDETGLPLLADSFDHLASLPSTSKITDGDFNLPGAAWSMTTASPSLTSFVSHLYYGGCGLHVLGKIIIY